MDYLAVIEGIGQSGDTPVGVDGEEPGFFLGVFGDVDGVRFVGETVGCVNDRRESVIEQGATNPSSSRTMEILMPLGVWVVYKLMSGDLDLDVAAIGCVMCP